MLALEKTSPLALSSLAVQTSEVKACELHLGVDAHLLGDLTPLFLFFIFLVLSYYVAVCRAWNYVQGQTNVVCIFHFLALGCSL